MIKTAGASGVVQVLPQIHRFVNFELISSHELCLLVMLLD